MYATSGAAPLSLRWGWTVASCHDPLGAFGYGPEWEVTAFWASNTLIFCCDAFRRTIFVTGWGHFFLAKSKEGVEGPFTELLRTLHLDFWVISGCAQT